MKIAVIGATGMIGHHTAIAVVNRGHELIIVHRASSDISKLHHLPFISVIADLDDEQAMFDAFSNVDAVINCAAPYPTEPKPWQEEVQSALSKMDKFYNACNQQHIKKVVYLGAAIALPKHPQGKEGTEELSYLNVPRDKNPYLQSKWAMDKQAQNKAKAGMPVVIGIPSMTFGEFDYGPSTGQLLVGVANQSIPGYVNGKRNVIYGGDAGVGLVLACEKGRSGERYLFTGQNITMQQLVSLMVKTTSAPPLKAIPLFVAKIVSRIQTLKYKYGKGEQPKISETAIAVMSSGQYLDGSKAEKELGFKATQNIEETIANAYSWFKKVGYISQKTSQSDSSS